jgi:hypothetical protein
MRQRAGLQAKGPYSQYQLHHRPDTLTLADRGRAGDGGAGQHAGR